MQNDFQESFEDLENQLGLIYKKGTERFELDALYPRHSILFSLAHSVFEIHMSESKLKYTTVDASSVFIIPQQHAYKAIGKSMQSQLLMLFPSDELLLETAKIYNIPSTELFPLFSNVRSIPRNNWCNEIIHRYLFERKELKEKNNQITKFLEAEIIKELYYLSKDRSISAKNNRLNLDNLDLTNKKPTLRKAIMFIESNLFSDISMSDISQNTDSSNSSILKAFKDEYKKTPFEYITDRRLEESMQMLKSGQFTVSEVAKIVGYNDVSSFISTFKKKYKDTPHKITHKQ